jgi:hypothetical protein
MKARTSALLPVGKMGNRSQVPVVIPPKPERNFENKANV